MTRATSRRTVLRAAAAGGAAALVAALSGCSPKGGSAASAKPSAKPSSAPAAVELRPAGAGRSTGGQVLGPMARLVATVSSGTFAHITVTGADGSTVTGTVEAVASAEAQHSWSPDSPLASGAAYTATATATDAHGKAARSTVAFTVAKADQLISAKMMPLNGETVGVGMPVVVILTAPVPAAERAKLTDAITLDSAGVQGAWRWISASELHWRPKEYWPAGTKVKVAVPLSSLQVGDRYGSADRDVAFTVGDAHISIADTNTHQMTTSVNGAVVKTTPISAGREDADPKFITRSGPHLVSEKYATYFMDGATVGLDYAETVQWATRIANSGEFVHAAPWSVPSQGHANVSHGCINVSPDDAHWFYDLARRGDVVEVTGTDRRLELTNGLGDWSLSWEDWTAPASV